MSNYCPQRSCGKVMFLHLSISHSVQGGMSASGLGVSATPPGQTTPSRQTPPGRHSQADTPCPVHAGIHTPALLSACWDTPPCAVHAGIRSTSGRYASHWNALLYFNMLYIIQIYVVNFRKMIVDWVFGIRG